MPRMQCRCLKPIETHQFNAPTRFLPTELSLLPIVAFLPTWAVAISPKSTSSTENSASICFYLSLLPSSTSRSIISCYIAAEREREKGQYTYVYVCVCVCPCCTYFPNWSPHLPWLTCCGLFCARTDVTWNEEQQCYLHNCGAKTIGWTRCLVQQLDSHSKREEVLLICCSTMWKGIPIHMKHQLRSCVADVPSQLMPRSWHIHALHCNGVSPVHCSSAISQYWSPLLRPNHTRS